MSRGWFGTAMVAVGFIYAFGIVIKFWPIFAVFTVILCVAYGSDAVTKRRYARSVNQSQARWSNRR